MKGALAWPFIRLYILTLLFFSANAVLNVMIPLRGHDIGASNTTIGIIMGAYMVTAMLFRPWAGQIIDHIGPLKILKLILVINGIAIILYGFTGLVGYLLARIMQGVCTAFFSMALQVGIIDALPEEDRSQGISLYSLFSHIPIAIGPLIALGLWSLDNIRYFAILLVIIAVMTIVVGVNATRHSTLKTPAKVTSEKTPYRPWSVFAQLVTNPYLRKAGTIMLVSSIGFGAIMTFIVLFTQTYQVGHAGLFLAIQAVTVIVARFYLRRSMPSDGAWHIGYMVKVLLLLLAAFILISTSHIFGSLVLYIGAVCVGMPQALLYPTLTSFLSFKLASVGRNVLLGLFIATADLGVSLGGILMGVVADFTNYAVMYAVCGGLIVLIILYSFDHRKHFLEPTANKQSS